MFNEKERERKGEIIVNIITWKKKKKSGGGEW